MPNPKVIFVVALALVLGFIVYFVNTTTDAIDTIPETEEIQETSIPNGWETYVSEEFSYQISYPSGYTVSENGENSIMISDPTNQPAFGPANFLYISVSQADGQSPDGTIYNYSKDHFDLLNSIDVNQSISLSKDSPDLQNWFTYTRLADRQIGNKTAKSYINESPWEFPQEITEYRYIASPVYDMTYTIGGYVTESNSENAMTKDEFERILSTFTFIRNE